MTWHECEGNPCICCGAVATQQGRVSAVVAVSERDALRAELAALEAARLKSHREANEWCEKTLAAERDLATARERETDLITACDALETKHAEARALLADFIRLSQQLDWMPKVEEEARAFLDGRRADAPRGAWVEYPCDCGDNDCEGLQVKWEPARDEARRCTDEDEDCDHTPCCFDNRDEAP